MIVSATVINLKKRRYAFRLMRLSAPVLKQVKQADGVVYARAYSLNFKNWYTLTAWKDEASITHFMRAGAHLEAMKLTAELADSVKSIRWESDKVPTRKEARLRLSRS